MIPAIPLPCVPPAIVAIALALPQPTYESPEWELARALERFPSREVCKFWVDFGEKHEASLTARLQAGLVRHEQEKVLLYREQVRTWLLAWRNLYVMQDQGFWIDYRLDAMDDLKMRLGPQLWEMGHIFPPVAAHWLRRD